MLILTHQDIEKLFSMKEAIAAVQDAYRLQSSGNVEAPVRQKLAGGTAQDCFLFMPGSVNQGRRAGIKIVSVFPGNRNSNRPAVGATMLLLDGQTGEALCLMDGTVLTQLRTGAATGAATHALANPDATIGALFGTGGQACHQLEAMLAVRPLKEVRIYSRDPGHRNQFVDAMQQRFSQSYAVKIREAATPEEAVLNADIITAATASHQPVFNGSLVKPGAHINGVGSFTLEMQELDEALITSCHRLFIDSWEACQEEAGDIMIPLKAGRFSQSRISGELGDLLLGKVPGRQNANEITVFKSVGIAPQDTVTADRIYQAALLQGSGQRIEL